MPTNSAPSRAAQRSGSHARLPRGQQPQHGDGQSKNCWSPRPTVPARREQDMSGWLTVVVVVTVLALIGLALSVRIVQQYEKGVLFRLGRVVGVREPGLRLILPLIEVLRRGAARGV